MNEPQKVEFTVTERFINMHINGASICQIGVGIDGRPIISFPNTILLPGIDLREGSIVGEKLKQLKAELIYQPLEEDVALPRFQRTKIGPPETPTVKKVRVTESGAKVLPGEVEELIDAIIMSYVREPNQTKARTAEITKIFSERFNIPVMSIAGVRANLTRGTYGRFEVMVEQAAKKLEAIAHETHER